MKDLGSEIALVCVSAMKLLCPPLISDPSGCPQSQWLSIVPWCPLDFVQEIAVEGQVQGELSFMMSILS